MCAGVQNVSLPIDMCHEMSHGPPIIPLTIPATMHQIGQGTDSTRDPAATRAEIGGLAICCPKGIDCPIASHSSSGTTSGFFATFPRVYTAAPIPQTICRPANVGIYPQLRSVSRFISPYLKYLELPSLFFV
jgi:hypothetical protein